MAERRELTEVLSPNRLVAYNLARARKLRGWTQEQAAERLEPFLGTRWSSATFSMAERSVSSDRVRQFTADDLVAFAKAFGLPVTWFLLPPVDDEWPSSISAGEAIVLFFGLSPELSARVAQLLARLMTSVGTDIEADGTMANELGVDAARLVARQLVDALIHYEFSEIEDAVRSSERLGDSLRRLASRREEARDSVLDRLAKDNDGSH